MVTRWKLIQTKGSGIQIGGYKTSTQIALRQFLRGFRFVTDKHCASRNDNSDAGLNTTSLNHREKVSCDRKIIVNPLILLTCNSIF